jgi:hypothetical protein
MLPDTPGHAVQVLWGEYGPDEEMGTQQSASGHDEGDAAGNKYREQVDMPPEHVFLALAVSQQQQKVRC